MSNIKNTNLNIYSRNNLVWTPRDKELLTRRKLQKCRGEEKKISNPGVVLIFNQEHFDNKKYGNRNNSNEIEILQKTLENFHLTIEIFTDFTTNEIELKMSQVSKVNFSDEAALFVVILSHGIKDYFICTKNGYFNVQRDFLPHILGNKTLSDKPKIFIIDACDLSTKHRDAYKTGLEDSTAILSDSLPAPPPTEIIYFYAPRSSKRNLPDCSKKKSNFIEIFCALVESHGLERDIKDILKMCLQEMARISNNSQVPTIVSNMTVQYKLGNYSQKQSCG